MIPNLRTATLIAALGILPACSNNDIIGGGGTGGGDHTFLYTAALNGTSWTAKSVVATESADETTVRILGSVTADSVQLSIDLHLTGFHGKALYHLGDLRDGSYAVVTFTPLNGDSTISYLTTGADTGSVNLSSFNVHSGDAEGTFTFHTSPASTVPSGQPDSVIVTAGHFLGAIGQ
jgi:hypothetical protein